MATVDTPLRIGYMLSKRKVERTHFLQFMDYATLQDSVLFVLIDATHPVRQWPPVHVLLHKAVDQFDHKDGPEAREAWLEKVEAYAAIHPSVRIIDPPSGVRPLTNRVTLFRRLASLCYEGMPLTPPFLVVSKDQPDHLEQVVKAAGLHFPLVFKPSVSDGSHGTHDLVVVVRAEGLTSDHLNFPGILQQFISHGSTIHKGCVVGDTVTMVHRSSVEVYSTRDGPDVISLKGHTDNKIPRASHEIEGGVPSKEAVYTIARLLAHAFGISLFNFDVVVERETGRLFVVDINYFPGYSGVADFFPQLLRLLTSG